MGGSYLSYFWEVGNMAVETVMLRVLSWMGLEREGRFFMRSYVCFIIVLKFYA